MFRTVLEQKIRERQQTLEEFADYVETFAREHDEPGTLSLRHLQRLAAGRGPNGRPLGSVRPATARLLERIFGLGMDELLAQPQRHAGVNGKQSSEQGAINSLESPRQEISPVQAGYTASDLARSFDWLDERAGWTPDTSRRRVMSRLAKLDTRKLIERSTRRAKVSRTRIERALADYYGTRADGADMYRTWCGDREIRTSILSRPGWLDLACPLTPANDRLQLRTPPPSRTIADIDTKHAVERFAEAVARDVRVANAPLYRLKSFDVDNGGLHGTVEQVPFVEYALSMDLLESELVDAITTQRHDLPLREKYLPDLDAVLRIGDRLCAGGALALCAIARPTDPYRGPADYALLIQERSEHVVNAARRLAVIPKSFHQPLKDPRADARVGATLQREMEEELFGRGEVDSTAPESRAAEPMHPTRLSEPMRWLGEDPQRLRMECTGFGLNLVSGNYEFASLIVIEDEEFWARYGGHLEANWESCGLRLYSSLDEELIRELISDEAWTNEGLFALLQGIRRLNEGDNDRINLSNVTQASAGCSR